MLDRTATTMLLSLCRLSNRRSSTYYLNGDVECSALVVDPKSLENDCERSALGEFVSGRLLNPYEAIEGKEFFD